MLTFVQQFLKDEQGDGLFNYLLGLIFIIAVVAAALTQLGGAIQALFADAAAALGSRP